jgi:hypothetical protein
MAPNTRHAPPGTPHQGKAADTRSTGMLVGRTYDLGVPPMRCRGARTADWPAVPCAARCCRGAVISNTEREFPSDKVYRRNDRGIVGVESRGSQGFASAVHTSVGRKARSYGSRLVTSIAGWARYSGQVGGTASSVNKPAVIPVSLPAGVGHYLGHGCHRVWRRGGFAGVD